MTGKRPLYSDLLWILSELLYYPRLIFSVFGIPGLALAAWSLCLAGVLKPDYSLIAIAWIGAVSMFGGGVLLKKILER